MTANQSSRRGGRLRSFTALLLSIVGVVLLLVGGLLSFGSRAVFDSQTFADNIANSLDDPRVSLYIAHLGTEAILKQNRDLTLVRPILLTTMQAVVSSAPFRAVVRTAVRRSHELALSESGQDILLSVSDLGLILRGALGSQPELSKKIPKNVDAVLAAVNQSPLVDTLSRVLQVGQRIRSGSLLVFGTGVALLLIGILISTRRRIAVLRTGLGLVAVAALLVILMEFGGIILSAAIENEMLGDAIAGVWDTLTARLWTPALVLAGIGLLLAAAATAFLQRFELKSIWRILDSALIQPTASIRARVLRIGFFLLLGSLTVLYPQTLAKIFILIAGGALTFIGLKQLFQLLMPSHPESRTMTDTEIRKFMTSGVSTLRFALVGGVIAVILAAGMVLLTRPPEQPLAAKALEACNGHPELCDRPLDQVVFPATHNSMSAADIDTWMFPNQEHRILMQLEAGIRGLLIDVHPGIRVGDRVKTDLQSNEDIYEKYEPILGAEGVAAAIRIRDRLIVGDEADRVLYLCHGLCELGATPLVPELETIREFLVMNPNEVLVIIIEDAVPPLEIEAAFEESGLIDFVFHREPKPPWPTLREMILSDERVLVLAENDSEGVTWYHNAFEVFQETPYSFRSPEEFSSAPNRGGTSGSLLLMNHWISTPPSSLPSNAKIANSYDVLLKRARDCQRDRGQIPNLIAVDFHETGDLLKVVRTLNGIPDNSQQPTSFTIQPLTPR